MCLTYKKSSTEKTIDKYKEIIAKTGDKNPYLVFWKVYQLEEIGLFPIFYGGSCPIDIDSKSGEIISDRSKKTSEPHERKKGRKAYYYQGIHVYTDRSLARRSLMDFNKYRQNSIVMISVHGYYRDFIAAGECDDAVFMKVTIPKVTRDRMKKRINNLRLKSSKTQESKTPRKFAKNCRKCLAKRTKQNVKYS